jgi:hypothetical protein
MIDSVDGPAGKNPMAPSVSAVMMVAAKYQRLLVSVVSTIGAHNTFQVCGTRLMATRPATAATLTPAWLSR